MDRIAQVPQAERDALFREATVQLKWRNVRIVEKDYWVCWTLDQLFRIPGVSDHLVFKGGTSLSKVHGIIERFSEDIDVSLDPAKLGFAEILARDLSPSQLDKQWGRLSQACSEFAEREILPALQAASARIRELADAPGHGWRFQRDRKGFPELLFDYPKSDRTPPAGYITKDVKIELGSLTDQMPAGTHTVSPYLARGLPELATKASCALKVLEVERTFWEKATLLHNEYHRPVKEGSELAERLSRHYYDLALLSATPAGRNALQKLDWLDRVREHKKRFFRNSWSASYDTARPGQFKLLPPAHRLEDFRRDYRKMDEMFFTTQPDFDGLLSTLAQLEKALNG